HSCNALTGVVTGALTTDADILWRRWSLLDFDAERQAGVSATDDEKAAARQRADECRSWLVKELGFTPESIISADSRNRWHLLIRVDLSNDTASLDLVNRCLQAVALRFSDNAVKVDTSVGNAGRITKLYGTIARKGRATAERPHRRSTLEPPPASAWKEGG